MRPIYLALATTAAGITGLLSVALADGTMSMTAPAATKTDIAPAALGPQLHYVDLKTDQAPKIVAALTANEIAQSTVPVENTRGIDPNVPPGALQYQPTQNWSTQLQYSYMSVGGTDNTGTHADAGCCSGNNNWKIDDNWKIDRQILAVQVGASYHFK